MYCHSFLSTRYLEYASYIIEKCFHFSPLGSLLLQRLTDKEIQVFRNQLQSILSKIFVTLSVMIRLIRVIVFIN